MSELKRSHQMTTTNAADDADELYDQMMVDVPDDCRDAYEHELLWEADDDN